MSSAPPRSAIPDLVSLPAVIGSPRIQLRLPRAADAELLFPYVSDAELTEQMSWAAHKDIGETRQWIEKTGENLKQGTSMAWFIEYDGGPVGCITLGQITWAVRATRVDSAILGYWLAKPFWGKGIMTEAATLATRWGFETLGLHKISVTCFDTNVASRRVIEKVGYRHVGRLEDDIWKNGRWYAHLLYELTAAEWADASRTLRFTRQ